MLIIRKTENNLDALRDPCCAVGSAHVLGLGCRMPASSSRATQTMLCGLNH